MKQLLATVLTLGCLAAPVGAQESDGDVERGFSLLEEGAQLLFRGLIDEMQPGFDEMQKGLGEAAQQLGPKLRQFIALVDDMRNYGAPERLPNGDIILRRLPDAPAPPPLLDLPPEEAPNKPPAPDAPVPDADGAIDL